LAKPRILLYDIETTPFLIEAWGTWQTDALKVVRESYILCFAYKWLGEKNAKVVALPDFPNYQREPENDKELCLVLREILDSADIVSGHNSQRFDDKKTNARLLKHGIDPPSPYLTIDTLKAARRRFQNPSNRLDALGDILGVGRKVVHTGKHLWFGCMSGDEKSWRLMKRYNKQDVQLLERVYERLLPWIPNHPNLNTFGEEACPRCNSQEYERRGFRRTQSAIYRRYQCKGCRGWFSSKSPEKGSQTPYRAFA